MTAASVLDTSALAALHDRVQREVDEGHLPAAQIAVGLDGEIVHAESFGDADDATHFAVFSCTKALIAAVVWQLVGEGGLSPETRVIDLVPSFAAADGMTLEHLLTHTGGFPYAPLGPPRWSTREGRLEQFGRWRLQRVPGERMEYHPTSAHWVAAEMITVVDGRDHRDAVRERVIEPLGLDISFGEPPEAQPPMELQRVGSPADPAELAAVLGVEEIDMGEVTPEVLVGFNDPDARAVGLPGGGAIATAAGLAGLYQAFLRDPDGLWDPAALADGTGHVRCTLTDPRTGVPANRTLGLVVAGDDGHCALRGMGHTVSPRAFGHNGAAGQIAWADPATGLSFAFVTSAVEMNVLHEGRRTAAIASRAGVLAGPTG